MPYKDREKQRQYQAEWHLKNSSVRKEKRDARKEAFKAQVDEYKRKTPCADCDINYAPWQMQFDHVRGEKIEGIAQLISNKQFGKVWEEIEKCELVCANCHMDRTYQRRQFFPKKYRISP